MSVELLDRTRKINKLLHNNNSQKVIFNDICKVLAEVLMSNVIVMSRKGKILGISNIDTENVLNEMISEEVGSHIDTRLNERLLTILSTKENVNLSTLGFESGIDDYTGIIVPIDIAGERLGTLFMYRKGVEYDIEGIILAEYGTTVVGLEMMRSVSEEIEQEKRNRTIIESAFRTLSLTEVKAVKHIFTELEGKEGILVASKIADRYGITRSVIVNALRKLESAGVIESKSSGMKGTYIHVNNDLIFEML
ncbi:MAG: GTP-sensing pleiotropic transcriptional regulator CodY [Anaerostipes sp.]|jgi:transcriptional pleiotropic repressor|nr:GTP-sensing pleiotropic transcriptional regulator CodY [Anaerostipes sp.]MDD3747211.1 GTP-sensing pleiotropic transcriptional regulator CodY [Anaerostipes sp.]